MIALAIHKTVDYCKKPAQESENELRKLCLAIHKTDEFCTEMAEKVGKWFAH